MVIHGAAGNVGAYAVQLARRAGVRTIATAGTDDIPFLRNLDANTVLDFQTHSPLSRKIRKSARILLFTSDTSAGMSCERVVTAAIIRRNGCLLADHPGRNSPGFRSSPGGQGSGRETYEGWRSASTRVRSWRLPLLSTAAKSWPRSRRGN